MYITEKEQQLLFEKYETPMHVRAHCNAVAKAAKVLAEALNGHGYDMDVDVIYGAGLVHDVLRVQENHDIRGAAVLEELGYHREAELVSRHMKYRMDNDARHLEEIDVLCLADRVVKEDAYVGIDERMKYLINKPGATPERTKNILAAKEHTKKIIEDIEEILGVSFDELFQEIV